MVDRVSITSTPLVVPVLQDSPVCYVKQISTSVHQHHAQMAAYVSILLIRMYVNVNRAIRACNAKPTLMNAVRRRVPIQGHASIRSMVMSVYAWRDFPDRFVRPTLTNAPPRHARMVVVAPI